MKFYNFTNNLLYILERRDQIQIEKMNLHFILDRDLHLQLFDVDKVLYVEERKPKKKNDENYFIKGMQPDISLLPPTFKPPPPIDPCAYEEP